MDQPDISQITDTIDQAREQLASTIDAIALRVNPERLLDRLRRDLTDFLHQPRTKAILAGLGTGIGMVIIYRIRRRRMIMRYLKTSPYYSEFPLPAPQAGTQ